MKDLFLKDKNPSAVKSLKKRTNLNKDVKNIKGEIFGLSREELDLNYFTISNF